LSALNYCPEKSGKNAGDWPIAFLRKPEKLATVEILVQLDFDTAKKKQNCEAGTETGKRKRGSEIFA